ETDVIDRQAEAVGRDLAERGVVALAVRMASSKDRRLAVAVHPHQRALPAAVQAAALGKVRARSGSGLVDEGSKPDAHENSAPAQRGLLAPQRVVAGERDQLVQQGGRIA